MFTRKKKFIILVFLIFTLLGQNFTILAETYEDFEDTINNPNNITYANG